MKRKTFFALTGGATLTAALSFGCQSDDRTNPPPAAAPPATVSPATEVHQAIATSEPESYTATLRLTASAAGARREAAPLLEADVARRGRNRRLSFRLPDGEQVVHLSRGKSKYVILPDRGRYARVSSREGGFEPPPLLMPDHLVGYLRQQRGYTRAGEEELNGRTVIKYVAPDTRRSGTRTSQITTENVVYVDKMTGLPLRAELVAEAEDEAPGGGVRVVTEMRNVRTEADRNLFAAPRGLKRVEAEQVRRLITELINTAAAIAGSLLDRMGAAEPAANHSTS